MNANVIPKVIKSEKGQDVPTFFLSTFNFDNRFMANKCICYMEPKSWQYSDKIAQRKK